MVNGGLPIDTLVKANPLPSVPLEKHLKADAVDAPTTGAFEWLQLQNPIPGNYRRNDTMAVEETQYVRHVRFAHPMRILMDGKKQEGAVLIPNSRNK